MLQPKTVKEHLEAQLHDDSLNAASASLLASLSSAAGTETPQLETPPNLQTLRATDAMDTQSDNEYGEPYEGNYVAGDLENNPSSFHANSSDSSPPPSTPELPALSTPGTLTDDELFAALFAHLACEPERDIRGPDEDDNYLENATAGENLFPSFDADDADPPPAHDLEADNLFVSNETLFNPENEEAGAGARVAQAYEDSIELPPAFDEDPLIRNIYIRTMIQSAFHKATHEDVRRMLNDQKASLQAVAERANMELDLDDMAQSLRTLERRLGLSVDEDITYYFVCPLCWDRHHPSELTELASPACLKEPCLGILYTTSPRRGRQGGSLEKRTPTQVMPYCSLERYIRRMFQRIGKAEEVQHWRTESDHGYQEPETLEEWKARTDPDKPLMDVHDGAAWRAAQAALSRDFDLRTMARDQKATDQNTWPQKVRFVSLKFGLLLTMNIDWCVAFFQPRSVLILLFSNRFQPMSTRNHSSGAVYFVVNNLPRSIRFLRENTFLVCVLPGPHEPSKEQMNAVLDPIRDEFIALGNGTLASSLDHTRV